jgi:HlyD family secretion protein
MSLSVIGLAMGILYAYFNQLRVREIEPATSPASAQVDAICVAPGMLEPAGGSIGIYPVRADRVEEVCVKENQVVKKGDVLFTMRTRGILDEKEILERQLESAKAHFAYLKEQPRAVDLAPLEDRVEMQRVEMERLEQQVVRYRKLFPDSITPHEMENAEKLYEASKAAWKNTQSELAKMKAGVSAFQLAQAEAEIHQIEARLKSLDTQLEESVLRSPIDGLVLKINIHPGEFISLFNPVRDDTTSTPVVVGAQNLQIRVDVDETDISRISEDCEAMAILRGDPLKSFFLKFNRIQPMVVPKKNLAGYSMERVDVRVIQLIFDVVPPNFPLWSGLQADVYLTNRRAER